MRLPVSRAALTPIAPMIAVLLLICGSAVCAKTVQFSDRFSDHGEGSSGAPVWEPLTQEWVVRDGTYAFTQPLRTGSYAWVTAPCFSDVDLTAKFRIMPEGDGVRAAGLVFCSVSSEDQYYVHYDSKHSQVIVVLQTGDNPWRELARVRDVPISTDEWHEARVKREGAGIRVYLNDKLLAEVEDDTLAGGRVGLRAGQGHIVFDSFKAEGEAFKPEREWVLMPQSVPNDEIDVPRFEDGERFPAVRGGGYFPVLVRLGDGKLGAVVRGGAPHIGIEGRLDWVASDDGGRTWSAPAVIADSEFDDRNPAAGVMADGTIVVAYAEASTYNDQGQFDTSVGNYDMFYKLSTDGGATWSGRIPLPHGPIKLGSPYGRVVLLSDGTALMSVYGSRDKDYDGPVSVPEGADELVGLLRSTDNGRTWGDFSLVRSQGHNETTFLPLTDDHIIAALRTTDGAVDVAESMDSGRTWSEPRRVTRQGQHPADLVDLGGGRVLMVYGNRLVPFGIQAVLSEDSGQTWRYGTRVLLAWDSVHTDCGYPSIVAVDDDTLAIAYYSVGVQGDSGTEFAFLIRAQTEALVERCMGEGR